MSNEVSRNAVIERSHKPTHEWYWGDGRPCCVNCGTLAYCEDAENMVSRAVAAEAERERLSKENARLRRLLGQRGKDAADAEDEVERLRATLERIERLQGKWDAPPVADDVLTANAAWAAVGSEAHKLARDALDQRNR